MCRHRSCGARTSDRIGIPTREGSPTAAMGPSPDLCFLIREGSGERIGTVPPVLLHIRQRDARTFRQRREHSKTSSIIASYATTTACPSFLGRRPGESLALTDTGTVMPQPFLRVFSSPSSDQGGRENRRSGGLGLTGAAWSPGPGACYGAWRSAPQMG
jgi:hypothetical protein